MRTCVSHRSEPGLKSLRKVEFSPSLGTLAICKPQFPNSFLWMSVCQPSNTNFDDLLPNSSVVPITLTGAHPVPSCSPLCLWVSDSPAQTSVKRSWTRPQLHPRTSACHLPAKCYWDAPVFRSHTSTTENFISCLSLQQGAYWSSPRATVVTSLLFMTFREPGSCNSHASLRNWHNNWAHPARIRQEMLVMGWQMARQGLESKGEQVCTVVLSYPVPLDGLLQPVFQHSQPEMRHLPFQMK